MKTRQHDSFKRERPIERAGANAPGWGDESGQSLVLVAVALVALMAMAALVLDGANLYANHRLSQNASDSGCRGATRELALQAADTDINLCLKAYTTGQASTCYDPVSKTNAPVASNGAATVTGKYLDQNSHSLGTVGGGSVPSSAIGIAVTTTRQVSGLFAGVLSAAYQTMNVQTTASCATGYVTSITNAQLRPLAIPYKSYAPGTTVDLLNQDPSLPGSMGWVNINGSANNANDLLPWIDNGFLLSTSNPMTLCTQSIVKGKTSYSCGSYGVFDWTKEPRWVLGAPGTKDPLIQHTHDYNQGERWIVFVFDNYDGTGSNVHFHIVAMAEFTIVQANPKANPKYIKGKFEQWVLSLDGQYIKGNCIQNGYGLCVVKFIQ